MKNNWKNKFKIEQRQALKTTQVFADRETNNFIVDFLKTFEWLHTVAYWDRKRYSIWLGTPSYKWEIITEEEAHLRARIWVQWIVDKYELWDLNQRERAAVVSFIYNVWSLDNNQIRLLKNKYNCALWNSFLQYSYSNWQYLKWLANRRMSERNLLCN